MTYRTREYSGTSLHPLGSLVTPRNPYVELCHEPDMMRVSGKILVDQLGVVVGTGTAPRPYPALLVACPGGVGWASEHLFVRLT